MGVVSVVTAPFRALWFLVTLPVLVVVWLLALVWRVVRAIASVPVYYLGRLRDRTAVAWEWTKERPARLALPWWRRSGSVQASQSTQTIEDEEGEEEEEEEDEHYLTPFSQRPSQQHMPLKPEQLNRLRRLAQRRGISGSQQQALMTVLSLCLEQPSPVSSSLESEGEETASPQAHPVMKDENTLKLIMDLMALSNTSERQERESEAHRQMAKEIASKYQYDSGKLQDLIAELDKISFDMEGKKRSKKGKKYPRHRHLHSSKYSHSSHCRFKRASPFTPSDSDSGSVSEDCVTAEDRLSNGEEEEEQHTTEYHSPPEDFSGSGEEDEAGKRLFPSNEEREDGRSGVVVGHHPTSVSSLQEESRQRSGSEVIQQRSSYSGVLSPVQESPEYARTPSSHDSAGELEEDDLNKALRQLDSVTCDLQADTNEVRLMEQAAGLRMSHSSHSESVFSSSPSTPNTVFWEKGTCVVLSSTPEGTSGERQRQTQVEETAEAKNELEEGEGAVSKEDSGFSDIPKVSPTLGLKEGHERQQLAVARSSTRRRPPTKYSPTSQSSAESGEGLAAEAEMKQVEQQMQQSVNSLSTLLVEGERRGGKKEEEDSQLEEESQSEEEDEKEPPVKSKTLLPPGAVRVLPSLSDQMSLLQPGGSLREDNIPRPTSPESLLEASLHSISLPFPPPLPPPPHSQDDSAVSVSKSVQKKKRPGSASPSTTSLSTLDSESGTAALRPRSSSLDSSRRTRCTQSSSPGAKPLMIPSSQPPWMEMRSSGAVQPLPPLPPIPPYSSSQSVVTGHRTRSSSNPPTAEAAVAASDHTSRDNVPPGPSKNDEVSEEVYDSLQPKDERIYDVRPVFKYLHQSVAPESTPPPPSSSQPSSGAGASRPPKSQRSREGEAERDEKRRHSSESSSKSRSSRESRSREERERSRDKEKHHHSSTDHHSKRSSSDKHSSSRDGQSSERKHRSRSGEREKERHSKSKESASSSSRKHSSSGSKSSSDRKDKDSSHSSSKKSSKEKEKERESKTSKSSSKSKSEKSESSKSSSKSSSVKGEKEKHKKSSEKSSKHRDKDSGDEMVSVLPPPLPRSSSRLSILSTSAIPTQPHEESLKKTTSLSSLTSVFSRSPRDKKDTKDKKDGKKTVV